MKVPCFPLTLRNSKLEGKCLIPPLSWHKKKICQKKGRTDPFPPVFHLQILAECSFPRRNRNKNPFSSWKIGEGGRFCGNDRVSLTVTIKDQQILDHEQVTNFNLERTLDYHLSTCQLVGKFAYCDYKGHLMQFTWMHSWRSWKGESPNTRTVRAGFIL